MAGELLTVVRELWSALDRKDFASILQMLDDEVQLFDFLAMQRPLDSRTHRSAARDREALSSFGRRLSSRL